MQETWHGFLSSRLSLLVSALWGMRHYTLIAGTGWLLDNATYLALIYGLGMPVFWAANIGILLGSAYVYAVATRKIFAGGTGFLWRKWVWFMGFTLITTVFWAWVMDGLTQLGLWPLAAKIAILPVSFYTNFLFLGWLQKGRIQWH